MWLTLLYLAVGPDAAIFISFLGNNLKVINMKLPLIIEP